MLPVYRRLRQQFLKSGSLRKYIFYAIGEIVLVMVGILLALQVNNWNQERNDQKSEAFYLNKLVSNLSEDTLKIQSQINRILFENTKLDSLTMQLSSETPVEINGNNVLYLLSTSKLIPERSAFDNLKFTNNLSVIESDILIDALIDYYGYWDGSTANWQQSIEDYARTTIAPYVMSNYPLDFQIGLNIHQLVPSSNIMSTTASKDVTLKNFIAFRYSANSAILERYQTTFEMARDLISMINQEL